MAREYRLVVGGRLSNSDAAQAFPGMSLRRDEDRTILTGPVRDHEELARLLKRVSFFGLTLLAVVANATGSI